MAQQVIRHTIDFELIPTLFYNDRKAFSEGFLNYPEGLLAEIFNQVYDHIFKETPRSRRKIFSKRDFSSYKKSYRDGATICLVTMPAPEPEDSSHVYCTACAIAVRGTNAQLFTVEKSVFGTTCIGSVAEDMTHINMGNAEETVEKNLARIAQLFGVEESDTLNKKEASSPKRKSQKNQGSAKSQSGAVNTSTRENIMGELLETIFSCSSPPLIGSQEENARWLMDRIRYFRENGIDEDQLYVLDECIMKYMPEFVADNFPEFLKFLNYDYTPIITAMEELMENGDYDAARKLSEPAALYLEKNRRKLIDGHHCFQNSFEASMRTVEKGGDPATPPTQWNYTAFLVAHARCILNTPQQPKGWSLFRRASSPEDEATKFLNLALSMSPENASVWLYLGAACRDNREKQLQYYKKALHYCYLKDGAYGLTEIYRHLAEYYLQANQPKVAAALRDFIVELGGNPGTLSGRVPACKRPHREVMEQNQIQIGFSRLALFATVLSSEEKPTDDVQSIIDTIKSSPIQKSNLFGF